MEEAKSKMDSPSLPYVNVDSSLRALAGQAEGFGRSAIGGLHGPLYHVTTLEEAETEFHNFFQQGYSKKVCRNSLIGSSKTYVVACLKHYFSWSYWIHPWSRRMVSFYFVSFQLQISFFPFLSYLIFGVKFWLNFVIL
ncbi:uncharacterized protein LOC124917300 [Impatiens glandulifera]|uniref:uncharacterized protein LOC124917300 n=1 Tax=Impatiens glandulifera TaxID=253017 RepID=UPI001FB13DB5|nr:uncharacterized protein LOC124917300 [Impatiens glandulifera]